MSDGLHASKTFHNCKSCLELILLTKTLLVVVRLVIFLMKCVQNHEISLILMIYELSSKSVCKAKWEKNQYIWSFCCYFEHLPNRSGNFNFGRTERMHLYAQFSKPIGSSYFH